MEQNRRKVRKEKGNLFGLSKLSNALLKTDTFSQLLFKTI